MNLEDTSRCRIAVCRESGQPDDRWRGVGPGRSRGRAHQPAGRPWPRDVSLPNAAVLVYQPQVNSWVGNQIDLRAALAIKPTGATQETFGVVFATARTQVDKIARTVVFENLQVTKADFPTLPNRGADYAAALQTSLATQLRSDLAGPARGLDGRGRRQARAGAGAERPAAGGGQLHAGHPGADQRRAGVEARCPTTAASSASSTRSALILQGRAGRAAVPARLRRLAQRRDASPARGHVSNVQPLGMDDRGEEAGAARPCRHARRRAEGQPEAARWPMACRPSSSARHRPN